MNLVKYNHDEDTYSFFHSLSKSRDDGKVLNHPLGVDSFPCSRLASDGGRNTKKDEVSTCTYMMLLCLFSTCPRFGHTVM